VRPSDYGAGDRLLHRLALGMPLVTRASFDLDDMVPARRGTPVDGRHVFVSGLARAGTTIVMRALYATGQFRSLTYRDMPFVLMPGLWAKLSASFRQRAEQKERAHGDGILVDFDSPEAFEEVFWRVFCGRDYIQQDCLKPHRVGDDTIDEFRTYVRRIVASAGAGGQTRYLSKNNNNVLRLQAIRTAFPEAPIVIPFREPLQQAISLLQQHVQFCDRHAQDPFSRDYMRWLGHHEFGATHKPFRFAAATPASGAGRAATELNYWLGIWNDTYRYLLDIAPAASHFVCYEDLCESPAVALQGLCEAAAVRLDAGQLRATFTAAPVKMAEDADAGLLSQARDLYQALRTKTGAGLHRSGTADGA
jgi:hypothetical protein